MEMAGFEPAILFAGEEAHPLRLAPRLTNLADTVMSRGRGDRICLRSMH